MIRAALVLVLALCRPAAAANPVGAAFLNVPLSVRQLGMGGTSAGGHDVLRAWSNPAVLADQSRRGQAALTGASVFAGQQSTYGLAASWLVDPGWSVGLVASGNSVSIPDLDEYGTSQGDLERSLSTAGIATAFKAGPVRAGVTAKFVSDKLPWSTATAIAADAGAALHVSGATVGVAYRNLGPSLRAATDPGTFAEDLPSELRAGASYTIASARLSAAGEYVQAAGEASRIGAGVEWWPVSRFALRAGTADVSDAGGRLTLGLSAVFGIWGLDYAMVAHPVGLTHRVGIGCAFGAVAEELEAAAPEEEAEAPAEPVRKGTKGAVAKAKGPKLNYAVVNFSFEGVSATDAAVITDMFRSEMIRSGRFNVVEKAQMDRILAEQAFQQTGCTSSDCAVKLGKVLNVHRMVVGSCGKLMGEFHVTVRVIDVESGKGVYARTSRATSSSQVEAAMKKIVAELAAAPR